MLLGLLENHYEQLGRDLRACVATSLIQLGNRDMVSRFKLLPVFFKLFRCQDKTLRQTIFSHIVNDVSNLHQKSSNQKINSRLQSFMFAMFKDPHPMAVKKSLDVVVELWKRTHRFNPPPPIIYNDRCPNVRIYIYIYIYIYMYIFAVILAILLQGREI